MMYCTMDYSIKVGEEVKVVACDKVNDVGSLCGVVFVGPYNYIVKNLNK